MAKWLAEGHIYSCFIEGYSIYVGTESTLDIRRSNIIMMLFLTFMGGGRREEGVGWVGG